MNREFSDKELKPLSRKLKEWVYGPACFSLYDISSIDTNESNSVLAIIPFRSSKKVRNYFISLNDFFTGLLLFTGRFTLLESRSMVSCQKRAVIIWIDNIKIRSSEVPHKLTDW